MKITGYEWAEHASIRVGKANPNIVGEHLELLRKKHKNELTPDDVVKDAKNGNSPLHPFFEWDDSAAAQQHRLSQARGLIRSVVAIYKEDEKPPRRMRAFVHIAEAGAPHYRDTAHAMSQTRTRDIVLRQAWREFQSWRKRYEELDEFAGLFETADRIAKKLPFGK
jgi:hypothetical protein